MKKTEMFSLHKKRHEREHEEIELLHNFTDYSIADKMPDPICFLGKDWDDIKLDLIETAEDLKQVNCFY